MVMQTIPKKRCAIYTRKSVEEGLDQEFNSLDAQREAGEAYIASQKANGWVCLPTRYDDGGYSGGNMKRPALQQLLADCEAGLVDIIVVYKIDRLSRSICDFADLSKKFDEWGTQFVAVTQEINTATSAGRMMLNILITFAQYEREVITERVRDKMAASRKKGKWVGGSVPMGYRVENKKLVVEPEEARVIQRIFQRFIEIQSPSLIAKELNKDGIRTKQGKVWDKPHIYRILSNHTYIGKVKYKGSICEGEQNAIVELDVWNRTREILALNEPVPRQTKLKDREELDSFAVAVHLSVERANRRRRTVLAGKSAQERWEEEFSHFTRRERESIYLEIKRLAEWILETFPRKKRLRKDAGAHAWRIAIQRYLESKEYIRLFRDGSELR